MHLHAPVRRVGVRVSFPFVARAACSVHKDLVCDEVGPMWSGLDMGFEVDRRERACVGAARRRRVLQP